MVHAPDAPRFPGRSQPCLAVSRRCRQLQIHRRSRIYPLSRTSDRAVPQRSAHRQARDGQLRLRHSIRVLHPSKGSMSGPSNSFFSIPSFIEAGLVAVQTAMKSAQRTLDDITGHGHEIKGAPVNGPGDVDLAVADFANRLTRVARYSPMELSQLATASSEVISAARASFRNVDQIGR